MTAAEFAARCPRSRKTGAGWRAPCPGHGSRGLTLSIREGRDGDVLLRCFANCGLERVTAALGLSVGDLFTRARGTDRASFALRRPTADEVREALTVEERRYRCERRPPISDSERLVAADLNAIRRTVGVRFGIELPAVARLVNDSFAGGYERDPLWPMLLERAWSEAWISLDGKPPCCGVERFAGHGVIGFDLLAVAEREAVAAIRAIILHRENLAA